MGELQAAMSRDEFVMWAAFYELHPYDDESRLYRPAALTAAMSSAGGLDIEDLLAWLRRDKPAEGMSDADMRSIKAHGFTPPPGWKGNH